VPGLNTGNVLVCPESLPKEVAYGMMKATFENLQTLRQAVAAARDTSIANTAKLFGQFTVPFHPGAEQYLKEAGAVK